MKIGTLIILGILFSAGMAFGQTLAPATTDDLNDFDQQLSAAQSERPRDTGRDAGRDNGKAASAKPAKNFGSVVSEEAREMKEVAPADKKQMGQWVRAQKQKSAQKSVVDRAGKKQLDGDADDRAARRERERTENRRK